jgi:hypothetical protein
MLAKGTETLGLRRLQPFLDTILGEYMATWSNR